MSGGGNGDHRNESSNGSVRSNASNSGSFKRRSRILMKIIPFARESPSAPPSPALEHTQRYGTFPRIRRKESEERIETLAARFGEMNTELLSPPHSASSMHSTFSSTQSTGARSTPATSPEMTLPDLPSGRGSGSHVRRPKSASSRESVRTLFNSHSNHSLHSKAASQQQQQQQQTTNESEWERMLEAAEYRASWQTSIEHRPRQHQPSPSSKSGATGGTWPKISGPNHQQNGLRLEHMFVDASDDAKGRNYAESSYSGFPLGRNDSGWSVGMSAAGSRQASVGGRPPRSAPNASDLRNVGQAKFGTLPRAKSKRPSTTGSSMRGEPAQFELKPASERSQPADKDVLGTASLGRATTLRKRQIPDAASIWQMGRRRSSGVGLSSTTYGSFSAGGATRMMPTIPQGHSRETSIAETATSTDGYESMPWLGVDPYAQDPADTFPRGYSISHRHDSLASESGGEYLPIRFYTRRESQDDIALLDLTRRRDPSPHQEPQGPIFNLHPFQKTSPARPGLVRSTSSPADEKVDARFFRHADVPEAVTGSEAEDDGALNLDGDGWCRRRSTFSSLLPSPTTGPSQQ
ncbi:hypothetical protein PHSY_002462 [Pseudozyma hubeiensis SY62]|uniref:Uncharacterized protein n=1 Tax=Pseudozyma hubeiensis (strain SY62) TaxID=1305764 RepID=R9P167_PSEHS|nr:hypothetical protein PHSY_002462 [Pseudozyma hubeiensis SY62]GAC94889.1 hypothetical protein PHSY_002462 [Pseudozyma hubeiensis SY62]